MASEQVFLDAFCNNLLFLSYLLFLSFSLHILFQASQRYSLPRRNAMVANKFSPPTTIQYLLIYFEVDKSYEILCSNSCLLPMDFDINTVRAKDTIFVKPDLTGQLIAKSDSCKDMEIYKRRLERKLDEGVNVANSSLTFLNNASFSECEEQSSEDYCADADDSNHDTVICSEIDDGRPTLNSRKYEVSSKQNSTCCLTCHANGESQNELLSKIIKTQNVIIKELKKNRKTNHTGTKEGVTDLKPVIYQDENLTLIGNPRMPPSLFGQCVARKLFSDNELGNSMLFPIRETGRRSLSPNRSDIFKRAVSARFNDDEDAIQTSIYAVNQLGNDIKRGRRKRKS